MLLLLPLLPRLVAGHPCDAEAASACPFDGGADLGACLKNPAKWEKDAAGLDISAGCKDFMALHEKCAGDIEKSCSGMHFSDDTLICLTQWTTPDRLDAACAAALPKKEDKEEKVDPEKEAWRAKRKKERQASIDQMKKEEKKAAKDSKKKKKKSKKDSEL
jgi:hypothetical protein